MTETFEWVARLDNEYEVLKKERRSGFSGWFEKAKLENTEIKSDYEAFTEFWENWAKDKKDNRKIPKNKDVYFVSLKIAQAFYEDCIEDDFLIKRDTIFASGKKYAQAIKDYFERGIVLNKDGLIDNNKTIYWIDFCSAMQRHYKIFNNIGDINKFLTSVATESTDTDDELMNFGLYVRNIDDLCIAYGILNGKSFDEIKTLNIECGEILKEKQKEVSPYAAEKTITKQLEGNFAELKGMDRDVFLNRVKGYAKKFLPENSNNHWSLLKNVLKDIYSTVEKIQGKSESVIKEEIEAIFENEDEIRESKNFDNRIELLKKEFEKIIKFDKEKIQDRLNRDDKGTLFTCIIGRLLINFKIGRLRGLFDDLKTETAYEVKGNGYLYAKTIDYEQEEQLKRDEKEIPLTYEVDFDLSISNLRSIYIVTLMKQISEFENIDEVEIALEDINFDLEKCNLRAIDYKVSGSGVENTSTDIFDWFIVKCIVRDKEIHKSDGYLISGFEPFYEFMGLGSNTEEDKDE